DIPDGVDLNDLEYIELHNPSDADEPLEGWRISGGVDLAFASGSWLAAGETVVVLSWNPTSPANALRLEIFREHYGLGDTVTLVGGYGGSLSDQGEPLSLWRLSASGVMAWEDGVAYGAAALPPGAAPAAGEASHRQSPQSHGLGAEGWLTGPPSPGVAFPPP
ncbi:MAG: lamin tail domain-containing protein, partial [Myxococcota bacterium]|nr:lamin tail domain-containing protein [Myxococcota bacterium]